MKKIRNFILVFLFLFPCTNLFAGYVTFNQEVDFDNYASGGTAGLTAGIEFNDNGTKVFVSYSNNFNMKDANELHFINEYNLSICLLYTSDAADD